MGSKPHYRVVVLAGLMARRRLAFRHHLTDLAQCLNRRSSHPVMLDAARCFFCAMPFLLECPEYGLAVLTHIEGDGIVVGIKLGDCYREDFVVYGDDLIVAGEIDSQRVIGGAGTHAAHLGVHGAMGWPAPADERDDDERGEGDDGGNQPGRTEAGPAREQIAVRYSLGFFKGRGGGRGRGGNARAAIRAGGLLAGGGVRRGDGCLTGWTGEADWHVSLRWRVNFSTG